ncbi:MAG TPA: hypothetical protein VG841_03080 [Caulobacterales bacterium]|nr:hypothetical protein [Caulobacterales bacterium]
MKSIPIVLSAAFLAACATLPAGGPGGPAAAPTLPSTPLEMGDWRHVGAEQELAAFEGAVEHRYVAGLDLSAASADLRRAQFTCTANQDTRGDPPAQICRKTLTEAGCTHTWQVHLWDHAGDAKLARSRGLYDRRCGGDGLLGGPG